MDLTTGLMRRSSGLFIEKPGVLIQTAKDQTVHLKSPALGREAVVGDPSYISR
jgi:hypothetical protein